MLKAILVFVIGFTAATSAIADTVKGTDIVQAMGLMCDQESTARLAKWAAQQNFLSAQLQVPNFEFRKNEIRIGKMAMSLKETDNGRLLLSVQGRKVSGRNVCDVAMNYIESQANEKVSWWKILIPFANARPETDAIGSSVVGMGRQMATDQVMNTAETAVVMGAAACMNAVCGETPSLPAVLSMTPAANTSTWNMPAALQNLISNTANVDCTDRRMIITTNGNPQMQYRVRRNGSIRVRAMAGETVLATRTHRPPYRNLEGGQELAALRQRCTNEQQESELERQIAGQRAQSNQVVAMATTSGGNSAARDRAPANAAPTGGSSGASSAGPGRGI